MVTQGFEARMKAGWAVEAAAQIAAGPDASFRSRLGDANYWDELYAGGTSQDEEVFDWFLGWRDLAPMLDGIMAQNHASSVLNIGCGNSLLPEEMYDAGYVHQTCVDVSQAVIASMSERNCSRPQIRWIAADCTDLTPALAEETFDLVIDKGLFDAVVCHDLHALMVVRLIRAACRATKIGGTYVCISLHKPGDVLKWLRRRAFGWRVRVVPLGHPKEHDTTAFVCTKVRMTQPCLAALEARAEERPDSDVETEEEDPADGEVS